MPGPSFWVIVVAALPFAGQAGQEKEAVGRIKSVAAPQLVVTDAQKKDKTFQITAATKIRLPGKPGSQNDLKVGYQVRIKYEMKGPLALAKDIQVEGVRVSIFKTSAETNHVVVRDKDGKELSLRLQKGAKIKLDGRDKALSELRPGDVANIFYEEKDQEKLVTVVEAQAPRAAMTTSAGPDEPRPTAVESDKFIPMTVFYGTDRNPVDAAHPEPIRSTRTGVSQLLAWGFYGGAAVSLLLGVFIFFSAWQVWKYALTSAATVAVVLGALLLALEATAPSPPNAVKSGMWFGSRRGDLTYGVCTVTIPKSHKHAELESPQLVHGEINQDPAKHVMLKQVDPLAFDDFIKQVRDKVKGSTKKDALVFVHGFNVSFEDAARRTGQLAYDLKFEGAALFYSWPSQGLFVEYTVDEANAEWTVDHLKQFLKAVATKSDAATIHLVAHSMGNRALTRAVQALVAEEREQAPRFNQIILAAPDIDADVFKTQIFPAIKGAAERLTLYASANDRALQLSRQVHGNARAGDCGDDIVILPQLDTIDVSNVDTSFLGHSYYGDNSSVLSDAYYVLQENRAPKSRARLRPAKQGNLDYWVFAP